MPKYNQRNYNGRYNANSNRQRNAGFRQNNDNKDSSWRHSTSWYLRGERIDDNGYVRHTQNRSPVNNGYRQYNNRNNQENRITVQTLITDPASKKVVDDYRKKLIETCSEEDLEPTVLNDKIVYVADSLPASRLEP